MLPAGAVRPPLKTVHLNRSTVVIGNLKTLGAKAAGRYGHLLANIWADVYRRPPADGEIDIDEDLYGGFVGDDDRRAL